MDNRPVDKWAILKANGFVWGPVPQPAQPDPWAHKSNIKAKEKEERPSRSCWIKHSSWGFKLIVKQYLKPGMSVTDLHDMWFETFDRFLNVRDIDAFQAAEFVMKSYKLSNKTDGGHCEV
jgi:hypothetical protein